MAKRSINAMGVSMWRRRPRMGRLNRASPLSTVDHTRSTYSTEKTSTERVSKASNQGP